MHNFNLKETAEIRKVLQFQFSLLPLEFRCFEIEFEEEIVTKNKSVKIFHDLKAIFQGINKEF